MPDTAAGNTAVCLRCAEDKQCLVCSVHWRWWKRVFFPFRLLAVRYVLQHALGMRDDLGTERGLLPSLIKRAGPA